MRYKYAFRLMAPKRLSCYSKAMLRELRSRIPAPKQRSRAGSAFIELGLFIPVLLLILMGSVDFARVFYASITLVNAAEAGALYGSGSVSASSNITGMQTAATTDGKDLTGISATATQYCSCGSGTAVTCPATGCVSPNTARYYVKVQTSYTFTPLAPIPGLPSSVPMTREAILRVQ